MAGRERTVFGAFVLGWREADGGLGMTYEHPGTFRSRAYDAGRYHHWRVWALRAAVSTAVSTYRQEMQP